MHPGPRGVEVLETIIPARVTLPGPRGLAVLETIIMEPMLLVPAVGGVRNPLRGQGLLHGKPIGKTRVAVCAIMAAGTMGAGPVEGAAAIPTTKRPIIGIPFG